MFDRLKHRFVRWYAVQRTVRELGWLSNKELADIGIKRHDIKCWAEETAL